MRAGDDATTDVRDTPLATVIRGLPIILLTTVIAAAAAVALSLRDEKLYQSSTQVFISASPDSVVSGVPVFSSTPDRIIATQAQVALVPEVTKIAARLVGDESITADDISSRSTVAPAPEADVLDFTVTWTDPDLSRQIADAYAAAFVRYRTKLEAGDIKKAREETEQQLEEIQQISGPRSPQVAGLLEESQRLRTLELLKGSSSSVGAPAAAGVQIQPRPFRNGIVGAFLGALLGLALCFMRESLNTRMRTAREVESRLRVPLVARIPPPPRQFASGNPIVSIGKPHSVEAESYRMLATNIELLNLDRGAESLMVVSALHGEGKSTTVANLSVAFARRGANVIAVEADLRRPSLGKLLGVRPGTPGLTDAAVGRLSLDSALMPIDIPADPEVADSGRTMGTLNVMVAGSPAPSPGDFLKSQAVADVIFELEGRADLLLIDTAPLLHVSDALGLMLGAEIDAALMAVRLGETRRQSIDEAARILSGAPIITLGFIATGAKPGEGYGGGGYYYGQSNGKRSEGLSLPSLPRRSSSPTG